MICTAQRTSIARYMLRPGVCLSVRPIIRQYCIETADLNRPLQTYKRLQHRLQSS